MLVFLSLMLVGPSILADDGPQHQGNSDFFGVSGGNENHVSRAFCCSGTLGSLLSDSNGRPHILSNNHVLARSDQAELGEDITQPGLIDNNCSPAEVVGDLSAIPPLDSNVDAAIANLRMGAMRSDGAILDIGTISSIVRAPEVGLAVAKSGRTTGFTAASIDAINVSVRVRFAVGCGVGRRFHASYTGQIAINTPTFSAGGDSGSLIVTNDACHQPVGLLFAGSGTTTIANPAAEVLTQVGAALGSAVSFVGDNCAMASASIETQAVGQRLPGLSPQVVAHATSVMDRRSLELMSRPSVIGVGIGASDTNEAEPVIVVFLDQTSRVTTRLPGRIEGITVKRVYTDPFVAF